MLAYIASNGARIIIVETASRFARDLMVQEVGFAKLQALGIKLVAADSPQSFLDDTPTSKLTVRSLTANIDDDRGSPSSIESSPTIVPGPSMLKIRSSPERVCIARDRPSPAPRRRRCRELRNPHVLGWVAPGDRILPRHFCRNAWLNDITSGPIR
jgi:hypothetical protein